MRILFCFLLVVASGCATQAPSPAPDYTVTLSRADAGTWTAEYLFAKPAAAWLFPRTHPDLDGRGWRPQSWTVGTAGVRLERRGSHDVLTGDGRPLTRVRIRVQPFTDPLQADYTPVLAFSDGAQAHFNGHYEAVPLTSAAQADALPEDLNGVKGLEEAAGRLFIRDPGGRLLLNGQVRRSEASAPLGVSGTYVYAGDAPVLETSAQAAVIDAGLPDWTRAELNSFIPRLLALYADRLGPAKDGRPMLFAAWGGSERPGSSLSGSTLPGLVVMSMSGSGLNAPSVKALGRLRWFLAHESAHFWLGQTVRYNRRNEAWITEGGANLMAVRALQRLAPEADMKAELQGYLDGCVGSMRPGLSLAEAAGQGRDDGPQYTCGAILYLAAESSLAKREPNADVHRFVRGLLEANRSDGVVTADDWMSAFEAGARDPALTEDVRRFVTKGVEDPRSFLAALLARTGVPHRDTPERLELR